MKYNLIAATLLAFASQAFGTPTTSTTISYQCDPPAGGSGLKCPFGYRCCGPYVNALGSCIPGEVGPCPDLS
ncbi:hypothetical protein BJ912DRAFT_161869 [Pholiota molesta]|nr:hypothetical protein BJ912DRAFT_161869 [Pholiota molesta]